MWRKLLHLKKWLLQWFPYSQFNCCWQARYRFQFIGQVIGRFMALDNRRRSRRERWRPWAAKLRQILSEGGGRRETKLASLHFHLSSGHRQVVVRRERERERSMTAALGSIKRTEKKVMKQPSVIIIVHYHFLHLNYVSFKCTISTLHLPTSGSVNLC